MNTHTPVLLNLANDWNQRSWDDLLAHNAGDICSNELLVLITEEKIEHPSLHELAAAWKRGGWYRQGALEVAQHCAKQLTEAATVNPVKN